MGDRPQDQTPADSPGPRPARPRPASSARPRPAGRSGTASRATTTPTAAGTRRAGGRPAARTARPAAAAPSTATSPVTPAGPPPAGPRRPGQSGRSGRERKAPSQNTMVVLLSILSVAAVGLVVYAFVLRPASTVGSGTGTQTTTTVDPAAPGTTLPASAFSTYTSPEMGFTMKYPTAWTASKADDGELIVEFSDGDLVSARLFTRTEVPTTPDNLGNLKAVTDGIVGANRSAVVLKVQAITVDGMPGYYYLYTFIEPETGATGAHAHYFLFRGRNMYTLVFQALPQEGFVGLSKVFDQMAESFQTEPDTGPAPETTTTPAG